jgi:hypothetical protein
MKVAIFSESPADEAAIRVLVDAILGTPSEPAQLPSLRTRGWPSVLNTLPVVLKALHYGSDAEALVVVVDSDDSEVHTPAHATGAAARRDCRFCQLADRIETEQARLRTVPGRRLLKTAVGLAVPAIEAWLVAGTDPHVTEMAWTRGLRSQQRPYSRRDLKIKAFGAEPVPLRIQTDEMVALARQWSGDLSRLERNFPHGFGVLAQSIRAW